MKKVIIEPGCISCGLCEFTEPAVFEVTDKARVKENVPLDKYERTIKEAAQGCPMEVITYEE